MSLTLPFFALRPIDATLPADLERYRKFLEPEPFRPATLLAPIVDLQRLLAAEPVPESVRLQAQVFSRHAFDVVLRTAIQGSIDLGNTRAVQQSGGDLLLMPAGLLPSGVWGH